MKTRSYLGVWLALSFLVISLSINSKNFLIYTEDFSTGKSLADLGFKNLSPSYWELNSEHKYMKSCGDEKKDSQIYSRDFTVNRDKGTTVITWQALYLSPKPGQAWVDTNKTWVSLADENGKLLYTLLYEPQHKGMEWQALEMQLSKDENTKRQVLKQAYAHTTMPAFNGVKFKIELIPYTSTGGDGMVKVYADFNNGRGYVMYLSIRDESYKEFHKLHFKYHTGSGEQNFPVCISNLMVATDDITPPNTTHDYLQHKEWVNEPVKIRLISTDACSGVFATYFKINKNKTQTGNTISLSNQGVYIIEYWSEDKVGNTELSETISVMIDKSAPSLKTEITPAPNANGWNNTDLKVLFLASDTLSGTAGVTPVISITTEGKHQEITGQATDNAGNTANLSLYINVDKTPPVIQNLSPQQGSETLELRPVIMAALADNLSGIDANSVLVTLDGKPAAGLLKVTLDGLTFTLSEDLAPGKHSIILEVKDRAGNLSQAATSFTITVPPQQPSPEEAATTTPATT